MNSETTNLDLYPVADSDAVREQVPVIDIGELIRSTAN